MTQYKFTVNGSSVVGNLTWNANGTLNQLAITDPFNSINQQTCNYSYDDLARLASANCGSVWSQTFGSDVFGNLSKSGTGSFQPTYNTSTNRVSQVGSVTPGYDANGNLTSDGVHTYSWDVYGHALSIDTVGLTYDALGRMVEQNRSGSYTEIVYDPSGNKLALMNGQTLSKGFAPLPGGATAVYTSGPTLSYYRHSDWLGSSRFASTPTAPTGIYYDGAYAPYGENYAEAGTTDRSFTGQNQDTISTGPYPLYDFLLREHHPAWGRWMSPDPLGGDVTNPQSLNRYAYVANNPTSLIDPLGLDGHGSGPPCGGQGQIPCDQYFQITGFAPASSCLAQYSYCYSTLGGATIGVNGSDVTAFGPSCTGDDCPPRTLATGILLPNAGWPIFVPTHSTGPMIGPQPQTPRESATKYCQQHGQLSFNVPFTDIPVTMSLSATGGPVNFSSTNDISAVFPVFPWPEWLAGGAGLDITINAPSDRRVIRLSGLGRTSASDISRLATVPRGSV